MGAPVPQWTVQLNGNAAGSVTNAGGLLVMAAKPVSSQMDFPYATADPGLFPVAGNFTLAFTVDYTELRPNGDGVVVLSADGKGLAWVWGDKVTGITAGLLGFHWSSKWASPEAAENGTPSISIASTEGPHVFTLAVQGTSLQMSVDGVSRLSAATDLRPAGMWAGHPTTYQLAGLNVDGVPPITGKVDASGVVQNHWWWGGNNVWTTFTVSELGVLLPKLTTLCPLQPSAQSSASCCAQPDPLDGAASDSTATRAVSAAGAGPSGQVSVRIGGQACLFAPVASQEGAVRLEATINAGGQAQIDLGETAHITYQAADEAKLDVTIGLANTTQELAFLPDPLPVAAAVLPEPDNFEYTFLTAVQVASKEIMPTVASVVIELQPTPEQRAGLAGAQLTVLYWDGAQWIDTQDHVGGTISGHGEPDLLVISATAQADGIGASVVVNHTSTYALVAKAPQTVHAAGLSVNWPAVIVGALIVAIVAVGTVDIVLWRGIRRDRAKSSKQTRRH